MKTYRGERKGPDTASAVSVLVHDSSRPVDKPDSDQWYELPHVCLDASGDLRRGVHCHSPSGFNWGYGGSGPHELGRMILADLYGAYMVERPWVYDPFTREFLVQVGRQWSLSETLIRAWVAATFPASSALPGAWVNPDNGQARPTTEPPPAFERGSWWAESVVLESILHGAHAEISAGILRGDWEMFCGEIITPRVPESDPRATSLQRCDACARNMGAEEDGVLCIGCGAATHTFSECPE